MNWWGIALATVEAALVVRIWWLMARSRRWDTRWKIIKIVRIHEIFADVAWHKYRDEAFAEAQRLYEARTDLPAFTARQILTTENDTMGQRVYPFRVVK